MVGVIVGGLLAMLAVALGLAGAVVIIRATSDASARATVLGIKGAAVGAGRDVPEVSRVYAPEVPRGRVVQVAAARRLAVEAPPVDGLCLPYRSEAEPEQTRPPREFSGW